MKDQDLLRNLQKEIAEEFCEPFQGEQKEECVTYYEEWIDKEEEQKQTGEQK
jgi:TorA maturation chaperone TorD